MTRKTEWHKHLARMTLIGALALSLAGCSTVKGWFGGDDEDEDKVARLPGERLTVMSAGSDLPVDAALKDIAFRPAPQQENSSWPQRGGNAANAIGALKSSGLDDDESVSIGDGNEWETVLVTEPVVADGVLYAMDANGFISAHRTADLDDRLWLSDVPAIEEDEPVLGGGLAIAGDRLYVATGQGLLFAINAKDGKEIWRKNIGSPMRSAPKVQGGILYISTVDDQLFAISGGTGEIEWQHRGMGERVGFLSAVSPAIGDNIVVVTYTSGDIYGLSADTGQELWSDSLATPRKTSATSVFAGFAGDAVIAGGVAFASSSNGLSAATHILSGKRLWEQEIASAGTPWLAGNYLFVLTSEAQVAAVYARDGRVKWAHPLERFENPKRQLDPYKWYGPMILGEQLAVFGAHGVLVLLSPEDGTEIGRLDVPDDIGATPIVADGTVYIVTRNGKLHALR